MFLTGEKNIKFISALQSSLKTKFHPAHQKMYSIIAPKILNNFRTKNNYTLQFLNHRGQITAPFTITTRLVLFKDTIHVYSENYKNFFYAFHPTVYNNIE
jgi:hypothetical protein